MWYQLFMSDAIHGTRKKRGRPKIGSAQVQVRMPPDELAILDRFIAENHPEMTRPEAIRECIRQWSAMKGVG
jgi:hypothetical protein